MTMSETPINPQTDSDVCFGDVFCSRRLKELSSVSATLLHRPEPRLFFLRLGDVVQGLERSLSRNGSHRPATGIELILAL